MRHDIGVIAGEKNSTIRQPVARGGTSDLNRGSLWCRKNIIVPVPNLARSARRNILPAPLI